MFLSGRFKTNPNIAYLHISGFAKGSTGAAQVQDWARDIDGIIASFEGSAALVLDIRGNRGGLQANVDYIAGRFAAEEKDYLENLSTTQHG
jgi:C-terminal processing protease CtpA/Prc